MPSTLRNLWRLLIRSIVPPTFPCDGRLVIDGQVISTAVLTQRDRSGSLILRPHLDSSEYWSRTRLVVSSFFSILGPALAQQGPERTATISELIAKISHWEKGPLGHPGDGEYEVRPLTCLAVHISDTDQSIVIILRGETAGGQKIALGKVDPSPPTPLPWSFEVEVQLPLAVLNKLVP